ncbi:uncharacterized membrane protein YcgQ (UPF0703/DUF1980 family) [Microbacteriaceae bacterium SG_E_30_P1]|uniref:Uncharacterized membrane protein YcgQ (UPF0703/DUF1980 family) n=1 Tax=Antiquaquibacter oligotrophicus TaxID=2880260 RepID=A0ABT6KR68_9MICO|nr:hypothetical protein [Antiquaquibacter oligotrophicus]MDH6182475.1 uncharacterized membrane protein YcgQ (UPF0703/DUF1980 family) [Antiquaquibacter oligotrophicus]UDF14555.1 hypothetical protein LH407_06750 [Antiquaquibacter oligotrophicus]
MTHNNTTQRPGFWLRAIEYRKYQLAREERRALRDRFAEKSRDGISDEDYATTMATLEKMARNLGWDGEDVPRRGFAPFGPGPRGRRGFGGHPHHGDHPCGPDA